MSAPAGATAGRIHVIVSTDTDLLALRTAIEGLPSGFPAVSAATTWAPGGMQARRRVASRDCTRAASHPVRASGLMARISTRKSRGNRSR